MKVLTLFLLLFFVESWAVEVDEKLSIRLLQDLGLSEQSLGELLSSLQNLAKKDVAIAKEKEKLLSMESVHQPGDNLRNMEDPNAIASLLPFQSSVGNASWFWQMFHKHQSACANSYSTYRDAVVYECNFPSEPTTSNIPAGTSIYHSNAKQQLFARIFKYGLGSSPYNSAGFPCPLHPENQTFISNCVFRRLTDLKDITESNCKAHMCVVDGFIETFNNISTGLNAVCTKRMENLTNLWQEGQNEDSPPLFDSTCSSGQNLALGSVLQKISAERNNEIGNLFINQYNYTHLHGYGTSTTFLDTYIRCVEKYKLSNGTGNAHETGITFSAHRDFWEEALKTCFTTEMVRQVGDDTASDCKKYMDDCSDNRVQTYWGSSDDIDLKKDMIRVLYCKSHSAPDEWECDSLL